MKNERNKEKRRKEKRQNITVITNATQSSPCVICKSLWSISWSLLITAFRERCDCYHFTLWKWRYGTHGSSNFQRCPQTRHLSTLMPLCPSACHYSNKYPVESTYKGKRVSLAHSLGGFSSEPVGSLAFGHVANQHITARIPCGAMYSPQGQDTQTHVHTHAHAHIHACMCTPGSHSVLLSHVSNDLNLPSRFHLFQFLPPCNTWDQAFTHGPLGHVWGPRSSII